MNTESSTQNHIHPNVSGLVHIPRSSLVLKRVHDGMTTSELELIPELPRQHFYLSVSEIAFLKPKMPHSCSEVDITVDLSKKTDKHVLLLKIHNTGKVTTSVVA